MNNKEVRDLILNNRSIRKQILLTPVDSEHLKIVADHTGLSQNEIINKGLSAYLARYKKLFVDAKDSIESTGLKPIRIEGSSMLEAPEEE